MHTVSSTLLTNARGTTAIEYAIIASIISIAAFSVFISIGTSVSGLFSQVANGF